jgi:hypothetical protein
MKTFFKTTLVAAAVAVTCGTATAGTVTTVKQVHSKEGLTGVTANQTSNAVTYKLAAGYLAGDRIKFTFSEGSLVPTALPTVLSVPAFDSDNPALAIAGLALGIGGSDANSVEYRVLSVNQPKRVSAIQEDPTCTPNVPVGNECATTVDTYTSISTLNNVVSLGPVVYKAATVLTSPVTVTVASVDAAGNAIDPNGTRTGTIAEAKSQFGAVVVDSATEFNGIIDVSQMRQKFTSGLTDSMSYTVDNPSTTGWMNLATVTGSTAVVSGEAGKMTDVLEGDWSSANGTLTFTQDSARVAIAYSVGVTNDTVVFTAPSGDKAITLEAQKFITDVVYNYSSAGAVTGSAIIGAGVASGSWKLNGATVNIPYMPYSPNASQIMYVTNAGSQAGDIVVTAFDDQGKMYDLGAIGVAGAKKVTKITTLVKKALEAQGFVGGKLSITVTVNAPEADISVYASYNAGSVRGFVNTDQYKGKVDGAHSH